MAWDVLAAINNSFIFHTAAFKSFAVPREHLFEISNDRLILMILMLLLNRECCCCGKIIAAHYPLLLVVVVAKLKKKLLEKVLRPHSKKRVMEK